MQSLPFVYIICGSICLNYTTMSYNKMTMTNFVNKSNIIGKIIIDTEELNINKQVTSHSSQDFSFSVFCIVYLFSTFSTFSISLSECKNDLFMHFIIYAAHSFYLHQ